MFAGGKNRLGLDLTANTTILLATASSMIFCVFPVILGLIARHQGLGWEGLGWVGAALQLGMLVGTLAAPLAVMGSRHRTAVLFAAATAAVLSILVAYAGSINQLVFLEFATGAAAGCVFGIAGGLLVRFSNPERNFAIVLGLQAVFGSGFAALLPRLEGRFGSIVAESSVAVWFLAVCVVSYRLRNCDFANPPRARHKLRFEGANLRSVAAVLGLMAFEVAVLTVWLYSDRVGQYWGFTPVRVDASIALGNLGAVPAAILAAMLRDRYGHLPLIIVCIGLTIVAEAFILWPTSVSYFAASQIGLNFAWTLGIAYYVGLAARCDVSGRLMPLVPGAVAISSVVAPLCVAVFGRDRDPSSLAAIAIVFGALALTLTVFSARLRRPELVAPELVAN